MYSRVFVGSKALGLSTYAAALSVFTVFCPVALISHINTEVQHTKKYHFLWFLLFYLELGQLFL